MGQYGVESRGDRNNRNKGVILMSIREKAFCILNRLTNEQLEAFVTLFGGNFILEEEPDEWDKEMIKRGMGDKSESIPLAQAAAEMGIDLNDL